MSAYLTDRKYLKILYEPFFASKTMRTIYNEYTDMYTNSYKSCHVMVDKNEKIPKGLSFIGKYVWHSEKKKLYPRVWFLVFLPLKHFSLIYKRCAVEKITWDAYVFNMLTEIFSLVYIVPKVFLWFPFFKLSFWSWTWH